MDKIGEWKEMGLELFYLPPYRQHLKIIEILWRKMKHEWLRPEDFNSAEALHARIKDILANYGNGLFDIDFKHVKNVMIILSNYLYNYLLT